MTYLHIPIGLITHNDDDSYNILLLRNTQRHHHTSVLCIIHHSVKYARIRLPTAKVIGDGKFPIPDVSNVR